MRLAVKSLIRRAPSGRNLRAFSSTAKQGANLNYGIVPKEDFGEFKEYSVIFTNRSLNLMSSPFQRVMRDLNDLLKETYQAEKVAIIPGYVLPDSIDVFQYNFETIFRFDILFFNLVKKMYLEKISYLIN